MSGKYLDHQTFHVHVLKKKGFPKEICDWTESFLSNRTVKIRIDDYTSDFFELTIGVPQGSPASPVLSCLYASDMKGFCGQKLTILV